MPYYTYTAGAYSTESVKAVYLAFKQTCYVYCNFNGNYRLVMIDYTSNDYGFVVVYGYSNLYDYYKMYGGTFSAVSGSMDMTRNTTYVSELGGSAWRYGRMGHINKYMKFSQNVPTQTKIITFTYATVAAKAYGWLIDANNNVACRIETANDLGGIVTSQALTYSNQYYYLDMAVWLN